VRREILTGLALTGASLLSACGSDDTGSIERNDGIAVVETNTEKDGRQTTYREDGSKEIVVPSRFSNLSDVLIVQWCEGSDLMTTSQQAYYGPNVNSGGAAGGALVTPDYAPCIDGRLTPSDFEIQE
jgi:hypothetical protein